MTLVAPPQLGLPEVPPADPVTVALGSVLFQSTAASADGRVSCATCHDLARAFTDGRPVSLGVFGQAGTRNAPTLLNTRFSAPTMWDGRRMGTADQVLHPFTTANEHGLSDLDEVVALLRTDPQVQAALRGTALTKPIVKEALTAYVDSLVSGNSAFDRFAALKDRGALSAQQQRGLTTFRQFGCPVCHTVGERVSLFTDHAFHPTSEALDTYGADLTALTQEVLRLDGAARERAVTSRPEIAALGRFVVTGRAADLGAFRTPSLRDVARTAPYFHDGSEPGLEGAVRREVVYRNSTDGAPAPISQAELEDITVFLQRLDSGPH